MKKYAVIYADCPWNTKAGRELGGYVKKDGKQIFTSENNKSRDLPYPSMSVEALENLNVKSLTAQNAHLYFWVTNQYLPQAFQIIEKWGFKYSTTLVWAKKPMGGGLGGTFKITTEFLIFATKGKVKANENVIGTWFDIKRKYVNGAPCHSKKPDFFHELIEKVSPGEKLEMFAREQREGWDVFGNEVEGSITIN
ncbi:MAG: MT-A70 family methyltransferase [Kaistella sp.]